MKIIAGMIMYAFAAALALPFLCLLLLLAKLDELQHPQQS